MKIARNAVSEFFLNSKHYFNKVFKSAIYDPDVVKI